MNPEKSVKSVHFVRPVMLCGELRTAAFVGGVFSIIKTHDHGVRLVTTHDNIIVMYPWHMIESVTE